MMPNFIIIGAPRAGTTSLYHYLNQHPQISMSKIKETNFFTYLASQVESDYQIRPNSTWPVTTFSQYEALFDIKKNTKAIGEASPVYLYTPNVPKLINKHLPNVKLILILRNPIERAFSSYLKDCREGVEKRSFEVAVTEELQDPKKIIASINFYIRAGLYFEHLTRFSEYFNSSQIKILFQEDLYKEPSFVLRNLFDYLEVDNQFVPDTTVRFNEAIPPLFIKKPSMRQAMKNGRVRYVNGFQVDCIFLC
jgi:hypothetical protein